MEACFNEKFYMELIDAIKCPCKYRGSRFYCRTFASRHQDNDLTAKNVLTL